MIRELGRRSGFTMIEVIFVIVVLGILAAIAVPKFAATREDAEISAGRATIASVRSGIVSERQKRLLRGDSSYIGDLGDGFSTVLSYPAKNWSKSGNTYTYTVGQSSCAFVYDSTNGTFTGSGLSGDCTKLDF